MKKGSDLRNNLYCYKAKFLRAIDGDTVELLIDLGMRVTTAQHVRIKDINTPEIRGVDKDSEGYKKGIAAKERVDLLLISCSFLHGWTGSHVFIQTHKDTKSLDRYVADIYIIQDIGTDTWLSLGDMLVAEGLATRV